LSAAAISRAPASVDGAPMIGSSLVSLLKSHEPSVIFALVFEPGPR
jgi:hypothetical protein